MTAEVNGAETSRGRWSDAQFSFGEMLGARVGGRATPRRATWSAAGPSGPAAS